MNEIQPDELVYYKINDELYSGGFQINTMFHDKQTGGGTSHLAVPLGLYTKVSPIMSLKTTHSSSVMSDNYYSNNKTRKKH
jgi:hypothetical protein